LHRAGKLEAIHEVDIARIRPLVESSGGGDFYYRAQVTAKCSSNRFGVAARLRERFGVS
jgi:hypothetical protein